MKLQNMAVIFAIIIIPMTLILSAYIGIQIDTASLQREYDTKLLDATHDAVVAFQLNSMQNNYSTNADSLRRDVKASINAFFTSLATNLRVPGENSNYITQYIPAVVVTLYDGYYIYSPMEMEYKDENDVVKTRYEHILKPYIHYSVRYQTGNCDIVVNYSLDNYITIYGYMNNEYISRAGYLIVNDVASDGSQYKGVAITDNTAKEYYKSAKEFTEWVKNHSFSGTKIVDVVIPKNAKDSNGKAYPQFVNNNTRILNISNDNDPEEPVESDFSAHKREIMKQSIQSNLNNAIYSYSKHTTLNTEFRMPVLTEQDWDKVLSNVNIISFMQGLPVGVKEYNNYAIVTSTDNKQYVAPDLLYYIHNGDYHKLECPILQEAAGNVVGYRSIDYDKQKNENGDYYYKHKELACYTCIVNSANLEKKKIQNYPYNLKQAYYNTLARERWNLNKLNVTL
ncbi:MAG: hypothetical protein HFJ58_00270 [Clostridia bacterium]|nr:hypothetical protein [Clostridia bacterium]